MRIACLQSNVSREQATRMCQTPLRQLRHGRLRLILDFYVPYHFYRLESSEHSNLLMAIDAVTGRLDPYQFSGVPQTDQIETRHFISIQIGEKESLRSLEEKRLRMAMMNGFFKLSDQTVSWQFVACLHLPYWIGIYERHGRAHLEIVEALRGRFEGAKMRDLVAGWFENTKQTN